MAERKKVYEKLHPETRAATGAALVAHRWNTADIMSVVSFATTTAEKFGLTERHVRRMIAVGAKLNQDDLQQLRAAPKPVTLADLQVISKATSPDEHSHLVAAIGNGTAKSAAAARADFAARSRGVEPVIKDRVDEAYRAIIAQWSRMPKAAKRRFVSELSGELGGLLADAEATTA